MTYGKRQTFPFIESCSVMSKIGSLHPCHHPMLSVEEEERGRRGGRKEGRKDGGTEREETGGRTGGRDGPRTDERRTEDGRRGRDGLGGEDCPCFALTGSATARV